MATRESRYGNYTRVSRSDKTWNAFVPNTGWSPYADVASPPGSMISGQNCWIENGQLKPRSGMSSIGTRIAVSGIPVSIDNGHPWPSSSQGTLFGLMAGQMITGQYMLLAYSRWTIAKWTLESTQTEGHGSWSTLSVVAADSQSDNFAGGAWQPYATFYLPRIARNVLAFPQGSNTYLQVYDPGTGGTGKNYSYLTGSPLVNVVDVTAFDNSPVVLVQDTGAANTTRVQWPTGSDPEDWSSVGAGSEDLVDMTGVGKRIFTHRDLLVVATNEEIWIGQYVGGPFRFRFTPLERQLGMPFRHAALNTRWGIFWLADDYMIYQMQGTTIKPIGGPIQEELRTLLDRYDVHGDTDSLFISANEYNTTVTLHFNDTASEAINAARTLGATKAFTYHVNENAWTRHTYGIGMTDGISVPSRWVGSTGNAVGIVHANTYFSTASGYVCAYNHDAQTDVPLTSLYTVEKDFLTPAFTGDFLQRKLVDQVRVDVQGNNASNLSISASGDLGKNFGTEYSKAVSVQSQTDQLYVPMSNVPAGQYPAVRIRSEGTGWAISRIAVRAEPVGTENG